MSVDPYRPRGAPPSPYAEKVSQRIKADQAKRKAEIAEERLQNELKRQQRQQQQQQPQAFRWRLLTIKNLLKVVLQKGQVTQMEEYLLQFKGKAVMKWKEEKL